MTSERQLAVLVPLRVEWSVSASAPFLRLSASESEGNGGTYVEFVAYFRKDDDATNSQSNSRIVDPPNAFEVGHSQGQGCFRLVRMVFERASWVRMSPAFSDSQVIEEGKYDWSEVTGGWRPGDDIAKYFERQQNVWEQSRLASNPRAYEVMSSPWLNEIYGSRRETTDVKHYLILGHDTYVEALATGVIVQEGQVVQ